MSMPGSRKPYTVRKAYPAEFLRDELTKKLGLSAEDHESRTLRTLLYRKRVMPREGSSADELARLLISMPKDQHTDE
jgi:hypothetical protein